METFHAYDAFGRTTSTARIALDDPLGRVFTTRRTVSAGGRLRELRLTGPDTEDVVSYGYDSAGRATRIDWTGADGTTRLFEAAEIDALGRYLTVALGNGAIERYDYAADGRRLLQSKQIVTSSAIHTRAYQAYDADSRMVAIRETTQPSGGVSSWPQMSTYRYDVLGRVTEVTGPRPGSFSYDPLGNLTQMSSAGVADRSFAAATADRDRIAQSHTWTGGNDFGYDGAGNVVSIRPMSSTWTNTSQRFEYDSASRAKRAIRSGSYAATVADLTWDASGELASLAVTNSLAGADPIYGEHRYGSLVTERFVADNADFQIERAIPGPMGIVARLRDSPGAREVLYEHGDHRGLKLATDADGIEVQQVGYSPYGRVTTDTGAIGSASYSRNQWNYGTTLSEVGVVVLGPRFYHPDTGRFLQRDPIMLAGGASASNPYSFAFNDPINFSDPSGLFPVISKTMGVPDSFASGAGINLGLSFGAYLVGGFGPGSAVGTGPQLDLGQLTPPVSTGQFLGLSGGYRDPFGSIDRFAEGLAIGWVDNQRIPRPSEIYRDVVDAYDQGGLWKVREKFQPDLNFYKSVDAAITACNSGDPKACGRAVAHSVGQGANIIGIVVLPFLVEANAVNAARAVEAEVAEVAEVAEAAEAAEVAGAEAMGRTLCFAAGTLVQTERGMVPIEEVQIGDRVWAQDEQTGEQRYADVVKLFVTPEQPTFAVRVAGEGSEEIIEATANHPFWVRRRGWVVAQELLPGDELYTSAGEWVPLSAVTPTGRRTMVYNFEVARVHNYFVGESRLWVHNACKWPRDFSTRNTKNLSARFKSQGEARSLARTKLGRGAVEVEPGKLRSVDGRWQYRGKVQDLEGHAGGPPHIHLERLNPKTGEVLENWHLEWH